MSKVIKAALGGVIGLALAPSMGLTNPLIGGVVGAGSSLLLESSSRLMTKRRTWYHSTNPKNVANILKFGHLHGQGQDQ